MLDIIDTAHPLLTLTVVVVLLVALWMVGQLHREIRVLQSRLDSVESEQRGVDEALEMLSPSHAVIQADPLLDPLLDPRTEALTEALGPTAPLGAADPLAAGEPPSPPGGVS